MKGKWRAFCGFSCCILLSTAASPDRAFGAGQEESPQEIVVTGDSEFSLLPFLDQHAVVSRTGQLSRWNEPICVRTWGLPLEFNAGLSLAIMNVAEEIGADVNRSELCRPNVRIGFTIEPQRMIDEASRRFPIVLGFHYASQHRRLVRIRFPVQAWYATATGDPQGEQRLDEAGVQSMGGTAGSRLSAGIANMFLHVLILVDADLAAGLDIEAMSGLLAMLALSRTTLAPDCGGDETILDMMNEDCPLERRTTRLTRSDLAFLRALYAVDARLAPNLQRAAIANHMRAGLSEAR